MKKSIFIFLVAAAVSSCCGKVVEKVNLVPYPQNVEITCGSFDVEDADVRYYKGADEKLVALAERFASQLDIVAGEDHKVKVGKKAGSINLILDESLAEEAYELNVGRISVNIKASSLRGFNWGIQTLKQLMPVQVYGKVEAPDVDWIVPCCNISDAPRFGYRGLLIDEGRHFFGMDAIKDVLDGREIGL